MDNESVISIMLNCCSGVLRVSWHSKRRSENNRKSETIISKMIEYMIEIMTNMYVVIVIIQDKGEMING